MTDKITDRCDGSAMCPADEHLEGCFRPEADEAGATELMAQVEELVGNPGDPEAQPAAEPPKLDPFDIAGNALAIATNAFNALAGLERTPQTNAILKAAAVDFDRATALAEAASSFGHALVARDQLIIMRRQIADAEAAKREVIITPGALPKLNRI